MFCFLNSCLFSSRAFLQFFNDYFCFVLPCFLYPLTQIRNGGLSATSLRNKLSDTIQIMLSLLAVKLALILSEKEE